MIPLDFIKEISKKLGSKIFLPQNDKSLQDGSIRQTNIFSKTHNIFVVSGEDGRKGFGDLNKLPNSVKKRIIDQYKKKEHVERKIEIRPIQNDFYELVSEYSEHFTKSEKILDKILPYLDVDFKSILKLASYVQKLVNKDDHKKAQRVKRDILRFYGKDGRKLCNLYLQGYVTVMIEEYIDKIFKTSQRPQEIKELLNRLISKVIKNSDFIFFINPNHRAEEIVQKVIQGMKLQKPYIALHSAGSANIKKTEEILRKIGETKIMDMGYEVSQENPKTLSSCPLFNIYITKKII